MNTDKITIEYTFEEHGILLDALNQAREASDFLLADCSVYELPEDSPIRVRYETLEKMREKTLSLWEDWFKE